MREGGKRVQASERTVKVALRFEGLRARERRISRRDRRVNQGLKEETDKYCRIGEPPVAIA